MEHNRIGPETAARMTAAWPAILDALANGRLVREVMREHKISDGMKRAYLAGNAQARIDWDAAREASADAFMDEALATANSPTADAAHARTKIDTLRWAARIRNPRLYGDKAQLDVNVRTVDLTRIIQDANARLAAGRQPQLIEGQVLQRAIDGVRGVIDELL